MHMSIDILHFKHKLETEKLKLEVDLGQVARINPENTADWEPVAADLNLDTAEAEERAGEITSFEDRSAIEFELEKRLNEVAAAIGRCDDGTFGRCVRCMGDIETARLEANPAATTCIAHME